MNHVELIARLKQTNQFAPNADVTTEDVVGVLERLTAGDVSFPPTTKMLTTLEGGTVSVVLANACQDYGDRRDASGYQRGELASQKLMLEIATVNERELRAELARWKEARQSAIDAGELMKAELAALKAEKAEREKQESVAEYIKPEGWHGLVKYTANRGPFLKPGDKLYLAPGAAAQPAVKPQECAIACPENQVCNYCQGTGGKDVPGAGSVPMTEADQHLCKFYGVDTYPALVTAQSQHIEKLQAKLPNISGVFKYQKVREG